MPVITILKRKGGVGSSTIAANLAGQFVARGLTVRLLDCDSQHSCSAWSEYAAHSSAVLPSVVQAVDTDSPTEFRRILEEARLAVSMVLVDAAPSFPVTALEAVRRSDLVLIPCGPSPLDLGPAGDALEVAESCRDNRERPQIFFIPSKNLPRTRLGKELPAALAGVGLELKTGVLPSISQRVAVAEAVLCGQTIDEYEPDGASAKEFAALADAITSLPL